jgi:hypothetical protein
MILKYNASLNADEARKLRGVIQYTSNTQIIAATILSIPKLKSEILNQMNLSIGKRPEMMRNKIHGNVSVLMKKTRKDLDVLKLTDMVDEMAVMFPELCTLLAHIMLPQEDLDNTEKVDKILPKLAMIYAIMMQNRNHELSALQRVISLFLMDCVVDQKVRIIFLLFI